MLHLVMRCFICLQEELRITIEAKSENMAEHGKFYIPSDFCIIHGWALPMAITLGEIDKDLLQQ